MKLASIFMRTKHLKWRSHLLLGIKRMAILIFVHSRPHKGLPEQSDGNQVVNRLFSKFK
jgi:hypothetical protein